MRRLLCEFSDEVTEFLSLDHADEATASAHVVNYANAVQRAASDLANRKARDAALEELLGGVWPTDA